MNKVYITGSKYFFSKYPGFKPKDEDKIIITEISPIPSIPFNQSMVIRGYGQDNYYFKPMTADQWIEYTLKANIPMAIARFLNKDFCQDFGITFSHLEKLKDLVEHMDPKHEYLKYIFNIILNNKSWNLSEEVLDEAYKIYLNTRQK